MYQFYLPAKVHKTNFKVCETKNIIRNFVKDLTLALKMIADDWMKAKCEKEQRVMIKYAQNARIILIFGYVLMIVGYNFIILLPCFGTSLRYVTNITNLAKNLPLETYYFYNKDQTPYYELTFIAQALLLIIAIASYTGVDNLLGLLVFHLCGQMENLKERLINMKRYKNICVDLTFIVEDHIRLIKYFDIVESTFTLLLLGLLLYFGILFCLCGFLIVAILTEGKKMSMIRLIFLISIMLNICGHMCLYCVVGEILIAQCEGVYHAAYNYEWYTLEPKQAKDLILIMIRANKPLYITAGKMFPMTLSMFCDLVKTSGGYVSVLLASQSS
ncbi:odorant receptor 49b-like [Formica exsecta]|uniref:odorant receptor 49b-like n=1 Tax=Formica exsecta TaxID=72781 RepID=UPI0011424E40|nr:odorant receptor 49b-like [Formica exsecta]